MVAALASASSRFVPEALKPRPSKEHAALASGAAVLAVARARSLAL